MEELNLEPTYSRKTSSSAISAVGSDYEIESIFGVGGSEMKNEENLQMLFDSCRMEDGKISVKLFLEELLKSGIQSSDPRLECMVNKLDNLRPKSVQPEDLKLDPAVFKNVLNENIVIINKVLENAFIIPAFDTFCEHITRIYEKCKLNTDGKPADYIPQLAAFGSEHWGVAVCTVDGQRFSIGHADVPFTIQSVSQAVTYAICLNELGSERVHQFQGREPSGRAGDDISLDSNQKPHNPLVNSGAILSTAMILHEVRPEDGRDIAAKYDFVFNFFKKMAGGEYLGFNNSAFLSERANCDRNRALSHFMMGNKCFPLGTDLVKTIELYNQFCSLKMTCESLSVIASTLANGGVCPTTGDSCLSPDSVADVRALMYSCGLYNYSGHFAFDVGIPAKSGVSGATMVVIPNIMGIVLWSPNLDELKNSVRGTMFCEELLKTYAFHRFDNIGTCSNGKLDPTFKKCETMAETMVQVLLAAANGDKLALQRFWLREVDMNISDYDQRTPLHLSAAEGHLEVTEFLLNICKVNPEPKDRWNRLPIEEAVNHGHLRVAAYIKRYTEEHPDQKDFSIFADFESSESDDDDEVQSILTLKVPERLTRQNVSLSESAAGILGKSVRSPITIGLGLRYDMSPCRTPTTRSPARTPNRTPCESPRNNPSTPIPLTSNKPSNQASGGGEIEESERPPFVFTVEEPSN